MEQRQSLLERRDMHHRLPATMKYQMIPLPFLWRRVIVSANPSHNKQHNSLFRNAPVCADLNCVWDCQVSFMNYLSMPIFVILAAIVIWCAISGRAPQPELRLPKYRR